MSFANYLKSKGVFCGVSGFIKFTEKDKKTIYKEFKENIKAIDARVEQYLKGEK